MQYDIPSNHHQELPTPRPGRKARFTGHEELRQPHCMWCAEREKPRKRKAWQGSNWIRRSRRLAIYARDGWRCIWCKCRVGIGTKAREKHLALAQLDHVRPRCRGGSNATENLITCCSRCNKKRGDKTAYAFAIMHKGALKRLAEAIGKALP